MAEEKELEKVGEVVHYFGDISVGVIKASEGTITVGDKIRIKGATTDFEQEIESMQIDREDVEKISDGKEAGIKVDERVREGDEVYLVE